jgi:hypothetical protein
MTDNITSEEIVGTEPTEKQKVSQEPSQNPIKDELERINKKTESKTELEKAIYTKQQIEKRIKELRGDVVVPEATDDSPMTVAMYKQLEKERLAKTSLQRADEIQDEAERELVKHHLSNTIKPTGNPDEDLRLARTLANSVKNTQIVEEVKRKTSGKAGASGSSMPANEEPEQPELSSEELAFTRPPFNLSVKDILKARKGK